MSADKKTEADEFAFPADINLETEGWYQRGMTLRDWLAGQALAGIEASQGNNGLVISSPEAVAKRSYLLADAMLKQREKPRYDL